MDVRLPDGTLIQNIPEGTTKADLVAKLQKSGYDVSSLMPAGGFKSQTANELADIGVGALGEAAKFAGRILPGITGEELQAKTQQMLTPKEYQLNPEAIGTGRTMADVGMGVAVGPALGGAAKLVGAAKYAPALSSGGLSLGNAATGSKLANALLRAGAGAAGGATTAGLINPDDASTGAMIGAAIPAIPAVGGYLQNKAKDIMQSALKPTLKQLQTGEAQSTIDTLLKHGVNATSGGVEKLGTLVNDLNEQIKSKIAGSSATVNKNEVLKNLEDVANKFQMQVSPTSDLNAITNIAEDFYAHPKLKDVEIPVQLAQELKQGTYKVLAGKYGEAGSAATEAQKALARGLKEGIAKSVPEIAGLNAEESKLITALKVTERRALMDLNKNPAGLALLANDPMAAAGFMADKSALFKSIVARMANKAGQSLQSINTTMQNIPAALTANNQGEQ